MSVDTTTIRERNLITRFAAALIAALLALGISLLLREYISKVIFVFFFAAIAFTSWFSGFWLALGVVIFAIASVNYFLMHPVNTFGFDPPTVIAIAMFGSVAFFVSWISDQMRVAADLANQRALQLEEQAVELEEQAAQLETQVEVAESANRAKGQFMAVMSHELRTPLNAIVGYTDLLHSEVTGPLTSSQRTHLERIRASSWHLLDLIQDVLSFSRIEAGRETLRISDVDAIELTRDAVNYIERIADEKRLRIECELPYEHLTIVTDPQKLRQILLNLLSNAVKFTDDGGVGIRLRSDDDDVYFEVWDSGPGIDGKNLELIFEPFRQLDQSTTRVKGGIGLGLPVSRRLAHLLGGTLTVKSEPGDGTKFLLRIPLHLQV